jgi:hypothetical protein|eukprot:1256746-Prymnesium_polylepis.1
MYWRGAAVAGAGGVRVERGVGRAHCSSEAPRPHGRRSVDPSQDRFDGLDGFTRIDARMTPKELVVQLARDVVA